MRTLQPLREFEILLIICAIIFLALLLLGIGCSYYCLKKRNIKVIRRRPASTLGSDVTKISEPISMFNGLKIPRPTADPASGTDEVRCVSKNKIQIIILHTNSPLLCASYSATIATYITARNTFLFVQKKIITILSR